MTSPVKTRKLLQRLQGGGRREAGHRRGFILPFEGFEAASASKAKTKGLRPGLRSLRKLRSRLRFESSKGFEPFSAKGLWEASLLS